MKNKVELKKYLFIIGLTSLCSLFLFLIINYYEYHTYQSNFNRKINAIITILKEKYPLLTDNEIIEILNNKEENQSIIFAKYGIDINDESIIIANDHNHIIFLVINILFIVSLILLLLIIFYRYNKKKENDIQDIIRYLEQINQKNYELKIDSISEDELSILKNEIYKTTILLKETAENIKQDKMNLKKSLEDISHQLKTPLTSIYITLDNLIEDPNMDEKIRNDFIRDIKREATNINFLVQSLLKLSQFDTNTIHFTKEKVSVKKIIYNAIKNISPLCDLKNITIMVNSNEDIDLVCDSKWQTEAITNILKNCAEHSSNNQQILINYNQNTAYTLIEIKDFGKGISQKDLPHIFERFYKGENSNIDSIGIGLSLTKSIIEKDDGLINVKSSPSGTTFTIKYYKY